MAGVRARYYDGRSSAAREVALAIEPGGVGPQLVVRESGSQDGPALAALDLSAVRIGTRVGTVPRLLQLTDAASIEVLDNAGFDAALASAGATGAGHAVRRLEQHWRHAAAALLVIATASWGFLVYGVPALGSRAVALLPASVDASIGAGGLALLDRKLFAPSTLPPQRQLELRQTFAAMTAPLPHGAAYRLEFRHGGALGANAFALPSGIVVLTDELVALAAHDDELRAVLAHEIGHLVHRHSMQMLVRSSATALLMFALLGDVSATSSLVAAVPTVLVEAKHSRDFEREADDYAYAWMARAGVPPQRLGDLLLRLAASDGNGGRGGFLASHPQLEERLHARGAH